MNDGRNKSRSPLHIAATYNIFPILRYLQTQYKNESSSVDWDERNVNGESALYLCARHNCKEALDILLAQRASVNAFGGFFGSPLQASAFHGHTGIMELLLDHQADPFLEGKYQNVLYAAFAGGHVDAIQALLEREYITSRSNLDDPQLQISYAGQLRAVTLLLDRPAFSKLNDLSGDECEFIDLLVFLIGMQQIRCLRFSAPSSKEQLLQLASFAGQEAVVEAALASLKNVNACGGHFGNALHAASFGGHENMVRLLIARGADVNQKGRYGTNIDAAALGGYDDIIRTLLLNGAEKNSLNIAIMHAASNGRYSTVRLFIDLAKSSPHDKYCINWQGESAAAAFRGHLDIMRLMLDYDLGKGYEYEALETALVGGHERAVELLADHLGLTRKPRSESRHFDDPDVSQPSDLLPSGMKDELQQHLAQGYHEMKYRTKLKAERRRLGSLSWGSRNKHLGEGTLKRTRTEALDLSELEKSLEVGLMSEAEVVDIVKMQGQSSLLPIAAEQGLTRIVRILLDRGAKADPPRDFYEPTPRKLTIVETAASRGHTDVVTTFLDHGAALGQTLLLAIKSAHEELVGALLLRCPNTVLDSLGDPETFRSKYPQLVKSHNSGTYQSLICQYALPLAVVWNHERVLQVILRHARTRRKAAPGFAIVVAARYGNEQTLRLLLEYRAQDAGLEDVAELHEQSALVQAAREAVLNMHTGCLQIILNATKSQDLHCALRAVAMKEAAFMVQRATINLLHDSVPPNEGIQLLGAALVALCSTKPTQTGITSDFQRRPYSISSIPSQEKPSYEMST